MCHAVVTAIAFGFANTTPHDYPAQNPTRGNLVDAPSPKSHRGRYRRGLRHRARDRARLCPRGRASGAARHERQGGPEAAAEIRDAGGQATSFALDVSKREDCVAAARRIADQVGPVSILVNNAGIARRNGMLGAAEAVIKDWEDIIAINLTGVFNVTHAFLASLRATKGRIVNIGSIQSFVHIRQPSSPAYTASKHGVLGFTKALAAELGKEGVRVNAIGPGFIATPLNAGTRANNPEAVKMFMDHTPLGRAGVAEDIVGPAIFLASDLSSYVTGSIVMADGGYRAV